MVIALENGVKDMDANPLNEKNRLIGSRLLAERESSEKTLTRSAEQLGVTSKAIKSFESGRAAPSLPQLELLAGLYRIPIERIMSAEIPLSAEPELAAEKVAAFIEIRNRIIAATIKQSRLAKKLSMKKLAAAAGISAGSLGKYESGVTPIPEPILQLLCSKLDMSIDSLLSPLSVKTTGLTTLPVEDPGLSELPEEVKKFVSNPANLPYLELAKRLSQLDATTLRGIAEDLLEITY